MERPGKQRARLKTALVVCALLAAGCTTFDTVQIDPSGRRIFLPPEEQIADVNPLVPGIPRPNECVSIAPGQIIAPVGNEVILLASICSAQRQPLLGSRVEWLLAPEGVGEFVAVGDRGWLEAFSLPYSRSGKRTNQYALGFTQRSLLNLTRGTATPADDTSVQPGQAWISVTSPSEGTSLATAVAPDLPLWQARKATGVIHWVDAQWSFPPPAVNPLGQSHVFTTTVARATDGAAIGGWIVRYEILGGPPAGFAPDGASVIEVATDQLGQASAEILQTNPQGGTARVGIQIVRPAREGPLRSPELIVATGSTTKTWTAPQLSLAVSGPAEATTGALLTYRLELSNPGDLPTQNVAVTADIPPGLSFEQSNPPAATAGQTVTWNIAALPPQQATVIELDCRAQAAGSVNLCATARTPAGLTATDCAATTVTTAQPALNVSMVGPPTAPVGSTVRYQVIVANTGSGTATGLTITDRFDEGLEHLIAQSPIERDLEDIPPGESRTINITFRVTAPGQLCHDVTVRGDGGLAAQASACLNATQQAPPTTIPDPPQAEQPPAEQPPQTQPQPRGQVEVSLTGPEQAVVNDTVLFTFRVRNASNVTLTDLRVVNKFDPALQIERGDPGFLGERFQDELVYQLEQLEPGQTFSRRIQCRCVSQAAEACGRTTATSNQSQVASDRWCLSILPAPQTQPPGEEGPRPKPPAQEEAALPAKLTLSLTDLAEGQPVGSLINYRIFVTNEGASPATDVRLSVRFPEGLTPLAPRPPLRHRIAGGAIEFDPIGELAAGEQLIVTIPARATKAGKQQVVAELDARPLAQPLRAIETTDIAGGRGAP